MAVDVENIDLTHVENVRNIDPPPTLAVSETEHVFGPLGEEGKRLLKELLAHTEDNAPIGPRVFGRLGLTYQHAQWNEFDLYWAEEGNEAMVDALREWNSAHSM